MVNTGVWTPFAQCIRSVRLLKEAHKGFRLSSRAGLVLSQTLLLRKKTIFEPFDKSSILKVIWIADLKKCLFGGTKYVSCCVWDYLVCVFESEYLKDRFLLISNLNNAKKIWGYTNKGLWILYNHIPTNWHFWAVTFLFTFITNYISLSCCCTRLFVLYRAFKWYLSLLEVRCLNVLAGMIFILKCLMCIGPLLCLLEHQSGTLAS